MVTKIIGEKLTKSEARKLVEWWNGKSIWYHEVRKRPNDKYYDVVRT